MWMLAQMRAMVETQALERLEQRLEELAPSKPEGNGRGIPSPNSHIARRIEALGAVDGQMHLVGRLPPARPRNRRWRTTRGGAADLSAGRSIFIDTGVPRSPDWGKCQESR